MLSVCLYGSNVANLYGKNLPKSNPPKEGGCVAVVEKVIGSPMILMLFIS